MNDVPIAVRNPSGILRIEAFLSNDGQTAAILSQEVRESLTGAPDNPSAARVPLCVDVPLAILDWLLARHWNQHLRANTNFRNTVRELLVKLSMITGKNRSVGIELSLVVRYLVAMAFRSLDVKDRAQVMAATFQNDAFQLPRYWPGPD